MKITKFICEVRSPKLWWGAVQPERERSHTHREILKSVKGNICWCSVHEGRNLQTCKDKLLAGFVTKFCRRSFAKWAFIISDGNSPCNAHSLVEYWQCDNIWVWQYWHCDNHKKNKLLKYSNTYQRAMWMTILSVTHLWLNQLISFDNDHYICTTWILLTSSDNFERVSTLYGKVGCLFPVSARRHTLPDISFDNRNCTVSYNCGTILIGFSTAKNPNVDSLVWERPSLCVWSCRLAPPD